MEKITVISAWKNEEKIAPFFLNHYIDIGVDEIQIILDSSTNDSTLDILNSYIKNGINIIIHDFKYSRGFCDYMKSDIINDLYKLITEGWVISCDADEFVFSKEYIDNNTLLNEILDEFSIKNTKVISSNMFHPFRNIKDKDLDLKDSKVILQRRYGSIYPPSNAHLEIDSNAYKKPLIMKCNQPLKWEIGNHGVLNGPNSYFNVTEEIMGVHWKYADPLLAVYATNNRMKEINHIQNNLNKGLGLHWKETEEEVIKKCNDHLNDPKLF